MIFRDWCKACGICSAFCPKNVISMDQTGAPVIEHPDDCIGCLFCELHCPDFAITIRERNTGKSVN
ncbi:MAG: 4Fe-4S binding protein [Deltaproteobacteria bacterium]|nr:4Fe-4S binding protein [Deltaproteobacteria bacterium]